jgi:geranylgeranyl pyrophosphate synthase
VFNDLKDWAGDIENDRRAAGDLIGGRPTVLWALAVEGLSAVHAERLFAVAREAGRPDLDEAAVSRCIAEVRGLYERADVVGKATRIAEQQRRLAVEAAASCRLRRLRDVLEFLLDLAVPQVWTGGR